MENNNPPRYNVGDVVPYLLVQVESKDLFHGKEERLDRSGFFTPTYIPWQHKLLSIDVFKLTCAEVHEVIGEWEDKDAPKKYHGFIFTGEKPMIEDFNQWYVDYPRASTSASGQEYADFHIEGPLVGQYVKDEKPARLRHAFDYLRKVGKGIHELKAEGNDGAARDLQAHFDEVKAKVEEAMGRKIVVVPRNFDRGQNHIETSEKLLATILEQAPGAEELDDLLKMAKQNNVEIPQHLAGASYMHPRIKEYSLGWITVKWEE